MAAGTRTWRVCEDGSQGTETKGAAVNIDIKDATIEALKAENARLQREVDMLAEAWQAVQSEIDKLPKGADT